MEVYIAITGEQFEASSIIGVFDEYEKAEKKVLDEECHFDGGWKKTGKFSYWENGCDYISIEKWIVE